MKSGNCYLFGLSLMVPYVLGLATICKADSATLNYSITDLGKFPNIIPGQSGQALYSGSFVSCRMIVVRGLVHFVWIPCNPGGTESDAKGINDRGQVVGDADTPTASPIGAGSHAFLYSTGVLQDRGTLPGDNYSGASGINNFGQVVGTSSPRQKTRTSWTDRRGSARFVSSLNSYV